jgi:hypothetical protein
MVKTGIQSNLRHRLRRHSFAEGIQGPAQNAGSDEMVVISSCHAAFKAAEHLEAVATLTYIPYACLSVAQTITSGTNSHSGHSGSMHGLQQ